MTIAQDFISKLQNSTGKAPLLKKFWHDYAGDAGIPSFQDVLDKYAEHYKSLSETEQKAMSEIFWEQVKATGTPIVEDISEDRVRVHFLFPQDNYDYHTKKLYVAGDYHGFGSTNSARQAMKDIVGTNVMHRSDEMPKDSVVTYNYIQVDSEFDDKNRPFFSGPSEALPESFYNGSQPPQEDFKPPFTIDPFENAALADVYSKHPETLGSSGMSMFCANVDNDLSQLGLTEVDWPRFLSTDTEHNESLKQLTHRGTYLCARNDDLIEDIAIGGKYLDKLFSDRENTRAISVFEPRSGIIDNVIIVNDGAGYMATNTVERLDKLMQENKIPENTAVVFVTTLPGLVEKYKQEDPKKYSSGMDVRAIEFGPRIEDYAKYLDKILLVQLGYDKVPASNRTLIGSSMSGTASLYMGIEHKDKFGKVIAQAPSYANRKILDHLVAKRLSDKKLGKAEDLADRVQLSNGRFDSLEHAQNLNLAHTEELAKILGGNSGNILPIHPGNFGHLLHCWSRELVTTLPNLYRNRRELNRQNAEPTIPGKESAESQTREMPLAIRQETLHILRERFKPADVDIDSVVYLSEPERRNVLMRINLKSTSESVPKSVILKQVLPQAGDTDVKQADARFSRDWAGLEFTSSVQKSDSVHNTPLFYGSDATQRFILIEDLGQHVSLVDSLLLSDRDKAVSALERYMTALGRFNATTFGHSDEYVAILKKINEEATTPEADLASTSEDILPKLTSSIQSLDLPVSETFVDEVKQVLDSMYKPGPFTVLTHGDLAPDNVFDLEGPKGLQLIDFEWCAPRNALSDGTYLRMSIPTGWCAKAIPEDVLKPLEQIYRAELEKTMPEASNDLAYSTAYTHACAYHVLHQMANLVGKNGFLDNDAMWGGPMPKYPLWDPATNSSRSRFLSRLQAFVDVATEHDRLHPGQPPILPNLRKMAEDMLSKVKERWPADTKPLDFYPAFKQDALQLVQRRRTSTATVEEGAAASAEKEGKEQRASSPAQDTPAESLTLATNTGVGPEHAKVEVMRPKDESMNPGQTSSPTPQSQLGAAHDKTQRFREQVKEMKPGYMAPTESSKAKKREIFNPNPLQTTPKPPWKP